VETTLPHVSVHSVNTFRVTLMNNLVRGYRRFLTRYEFEFMIYLLNETIWKDKPSLTVTINEMMAGGPVITDDRTGDTTKRCPLFMAENAIRKAVHSLEYRGAIKVTRIPGFANMYMYNMDWQPWQHTVERMRGNLR
jgi:hypothetical protein